MTLKTVKVNRVYVKSVLIRGITYFFEVDLQNKPQTQIFAICYGKQHYFKNNLCRSWPRKERNILETEVVSQIVDKYPLLLPSYHTYIMRGKTWKLRNLIFLATKEMKTNFWSWVLLLTSFMHVISLRLKGQLSKISQVIIVYLNYIWCVLASTCVIAHHSWPDLLQ